MNCMKLSMSLVKRQRNREEDNIGDNIADERLYEDHDKIMQVIRGYFWDRFSFWKKYPALFYGVILFLGSLFALQTPWALLPLPCLLHKERFFATLLLFLFPSCLIYQLYVFPPQGGIVEGVFHIHSIKKMERFGGGWLYSGVLKTDRGKLQCRCFSKREQSPFMAYEVVGRVSKVSGGYHVLKTSEPWRATQKRISFALWRYRAQHAVKQYIERHIAKERASQFLIGMLTGQLEDRLLRAEFGQLGLSHLMAISGLHFALLALFFHVILHLFLPAKVEACFLILLLTAYFFFIGHTPSILRAWCVAMVFLGGQLIEKRSSSLNSLGVALIVSLLAYPLSPLELSFQLSFLATAGILFFYAPSHALLSLWLPKITLQEAVNKHVLWQHGYIVLSLIREGLALIGAVHMALLPLLLATFSMFPCNSLIYNLFFPFLATIALFLFLIGIPFGQWIHPIVGYYCEKLLTITEAPPVQWRAIDVGEQPPWLLAMTLTFLLVVAIGIKIKERRDRFGIPDHSLFNHF